MKRRESLWDHFSQTFLKGCFVLLPLLLSIYFLIWIINLFDSAFNKLLRPFMGMPAELPFGLGVFLGITMIILVGLLTKLAFFRAIENWVQQLFRKLPIIGTVFNSLSDILGYLKPMRGKNAQGKAVIVTLAKSDFKIVGFLTRDKLDDLPTKDDLQDRVAVYIPLAYMVGGGFTIFVRNDQIELLDLPFERAMQLSLTAWMAHSKPDA